METGRRKAEQPRLVGKRATSIRLRYGWIGLSNTACLNSRKNSRGTGSRDEDGEEKLSLEEVLMGSPLSLAHTGEHMQQICAERKRVRKPGPIPSLFLSFQLWWNPGHWKKKRW